MMMFAHGLLTFQLVYLLSFTLAKAEFEQYLTVKDMDQYKRTLALAQDGSVVPNRFDAQHKSYMVRCLINNKVTTFGIPG